MKITMIIPSENGVAYHRMIGPMADLARNHGIHVSQVNGMSKEFLDRLEGTDIVMFNRVMPPDDQSVETIKAIQELGIKVWCDVDDSWHLHAGHLLEHHYRKDRVSYRISESIKASDIVTCTHEYLAKKIRPLNPNVRIIPNAINPDEEQWKYNPINKKPDVFGWMGSAAHELDLKELLRPMKKYWQDDKLTYRLILAGFSMNQLDFWNRAQDYLTGGRKAAKMRVGSMSAMHFSEYAALIDSMDIGLIPLADNEFNRCKSELKVLEFAAKGKAVIVTAIHPYTNVCNEDNSFLCHEPMDFYRHLKKIERNPAIAIEKAARLHEDCKRLYNWKEIQYLRLDIMNELWH